MDKIFAAPRNVHVLGNLDVSNGEKLNISCSYGQSVPEITSVKYCFDDNCTSQSVVSFYFGNY